MDESLTMEVRNGRELLIDVFARERFGISMSIEAYRNEMRTADAEPELDHDGSPRPGMLRWIGLNTEFARASGHEWPGAYSYRADAIAGRLLVVEPRRWSAINGPMSRYLTHEDSTVLIWCPKSDRRHGAHGYSVLPIRLTSANFGSCWKCLDEKLQRSRSGSCADSEADDARLRWSDLNDPMRPDMVPAKTGDICVIFECPRCAGRWFISPDGPNVRGTGCPGCGSSVSNPQIAIALALSISIPKHRVEIERFVAGASASDIVIPDLRIAVEYDGSRYHGHRESQDKEWRKDEALARAGWRTIRVREHGLADAGHPQTISVASRYAKYGDLDAIAGVLDAVASLAPGAEVDLRALTSEILMRMRREVDEEYAQRAYATSKFERHS